MKKSKVKILLLFLVIAAVLLTACNTTKKPSSDDSSDSTTTTASTTTTTASSTEEETTTTEDVSEPEDSYDDNSGYDDTDTSNDVEDSTSSEGRLLDLRIEVDHPGAPGFAAEYSFTAYYDQIRQLSSDFTLYTDYPEIKIKDNTVTVPANFASKHPTVKAVKVYAKSKDNPKQIDYYPLQIKHWTKTFEDNFDKYDQTTWTFDGYNPAPDFSKPGIGILNGEYQYCGKDPDLPYAKNGRLILETKYGLKDMINQGKVEWQAQFQTATIGTQTSFTQQFGCFMAYVKMPKRNDTAGGNTAFWLMPKEGQWGYSFMFKQNGTNEYSGYNCGEIDIMEYSPAWNPSQLQVTEHWWDDDFNKTQHASEYRYLDDRCGNEFINISTVWTQNGLFTYFDGKLIKERTALTPMGQEAWMLISNGSGTLESQKEYDKLGLGKQPIGWLGSFTLDNLAAKTRSEWDWVRAYK